MKLLVIFPNFGPYHMARLRGAAAMPEWTSCIGLEIAAQEALYPWQTARENLGFELETLISGTLEEISSGEICRKLLAYLDEAQPDIVAICGYERAEMRAALGWCNKNRKVAVLMSDSKRDDAPRKAWKEAIKKRIVRRFDAGLVAGAAHRSYLISLGIADNRIFDGYDVVDNAAFAALAEQGRHQPRLSERPYFLAVNRFVARKNLARVVEAWSVYRARAARNFPHQTAWDLVLCGAGEEEENLREHWRAQPVWTACISPGSCSKTKSRVGWRARARLFMRRCKISGVWSSTRRWRADLPILLSRACGCAPELLAENRNGWTFDPTRADELSERMSFLAHEISEEQRAQLGAASREIIAQWPPARFGAGLLQCARAAGL